jgi:hypothetical protein
MLTQAAKLTGIGSCNLNLLVWKYVRKHESRAVHKISKLVDAGVSDLPLTAARDDGAAQIAEAH